MQLEAERLREENEELVRRQVVADAALQESRIECDALRSIAHRLQRDAEALSAPCLSTTFSEPLLILYTEYKENLFRSFDVQLTERDDRIASVENELKSCYAHLREMESEHRKRHEEDKMSISTLDSARRHAHLMPFAALKDDLIKAFDDQIRSCEDKLVLTTAELNACHAQLAESDSIVERCGVCCSLFVSNADAPW